MLLVCSVAPTLRKRKPDEPPKLDRLPSIELLGDAVELDEEREESYESEPDLFSLDADQWESKEQDFELGPASIGAEEDARRAGLPAPLGSVIIPDADQPAFPGHAYTTRRLVQDLMSVGTSGNVAEGTQEKYFKVLQQHFPQPHNFPSYHRAARLILDGSQEQLQEYPVCHNDCWVAPETCSAYLKTHPNMDAWACPVCHEPINQKGKGVKVQPHRNCNCCLTIVNH